MNQIIAQNGGPKLVVGLDESYRLQGSNLDLAVTWFLESLAILTEEVIKEKLRGLIVHPGEKITIGVTLEI